MYKSNMYKSLFKYGDPHTIIHQSNTKRNTKDVNVLKNIDSKIQIQKAAITTIAKTLYGDITDVDDNVVDTIVEQPLILPEIKIPLDLTINSISLSDTLLMSINIIDNSHFFKNVFVGNQNSFSTTNNYDNYGVITNKDILLDSSLNVKFKNDLYFKDFEDNTFLTFDFLNKNIVLDQKLVTNKTVDFLDDINVNDNSHFFKNVFVGNQNSFSTTNNYDNYGVITNKDILLDSSLNVKFKNDLYFKDFEDNTFLTFDFLNKNIVLDQKLVTNKTVDFLDDIKLNKNLFFDESNKLYVSNNNLYYNDFLINNSNSGGIEELQFYCCISSDTYADPNFTNEFSTYLHNEFECENIDTTNITFSFDSTVKVICQIQSDITELNKIDAKINLQKLEELINRKDIIFTFKDEMVTIIPNIYLYNNYYYFDQVSYVNSFKLVKRNDETNSGAILSQHKVYLQNLNNDYLKNDFTFSSTTDNRLVLEIHGYKNNFLTDEDCLISLKYGFKLEVLPSVIINSNYKSNIEYTSRTYPETIITCSTDGLVTETNELNVTDIINNPNSEQSTFQNIGINPTDLENAFLSDDMTDFITDSELYDDIYLIDEKWLVIKECDESGIHQITYTFTYADNHPDTKKFYAGIKYCHDVVVPADYVFTKSYKLESIDDHSKFMFKNKHLPAIKSANQYNGSINSEQRRENILEELEKAHIYIDQLHKRLSVIEKHLHI